MDIYYIIDILEKGVERHGEIPLTNKYLLNILKLAEKQAAQEEDYPDDPHWD